jgi:hypothetical protein
MDLELKETMYLNVSTGDNAIFQEHKVQEISYNFDRRTPPDSHTYY